MSQAPAVAPRLDLKPPHCEKPLRRAAEDKDAFASLLSGKSVEETGSCQYIIPSALALPSGGKSQSVAVSFWNSQDEADATTASLDAEAPESRSHKRQPTASVSQAWNTPTIPLALSSLLQPASCSEQAHQAAADAGAQCEKPGSQSEDRTYGAKHNTTLDNVEPAGFALLGVETHFASQATQSIKLTQVLDGTMAEGKGTAEAGADGSRGAASDKEEDWASTSIPAGTATLTKPNGQTGSDAGGFAREELTPAPRMPTEADAAAGQCPIPGAATPMQQICKAIEAAAPEAAHAQNETPDEQPNAYQPLRTIKLALEPANLGTVAIQLSLSGGELGVKVEANDAGTAQLLRQENGGLKELLESAGYKVGMLSVQTVTQPPLLAQQAEPQGQSFSGMAGGNRENGADERAADRKRQERKESEYGRTERDIRNRAFYV